MNRAAPEALNQPSELLDYNLFSTHSALQEALAREGAAAEHAALTALGERLGSAEMFALGEAAEPPAAFGTLPAGSDFGALTARIFSP